MMEKYANNLENPSSNLSFPLKRRRPDKLIQLTRDGYKWRKYGRKTLMDKTCVRSYYKCTHSQPKCPAKKFVDLTDDDYDRIKVSYVDEHNHPMVSKIGPEKTPGTNTSPGDSDETFSQDSNSSGDRNPEPQNSTSDEKDAQPRSRVSEVFPVADTWNTMTPNEHSTGAFQANYSSSALTDSDLTAPTWMADVTSSSLAADLGFDFELPFDSEFRVAGSAPGVADGVSDPFSLLGGRNTVSLADFMFPARTPREN